MITKRYAGIGSREAPKDVLRTTTLIANILAELGYALYSGGCPLGMDIAFFKGAYAHKTFDKSKNRIYLSWDGMSGLIHDPAGGLYDAQRFANYEQAHDLGLKARGVWTGLYKGGIAHHCRNPYQVLGDDLASPVDFVLCWAPPQGKKGYVKGGTATAVKIALDHNIPVFNMHDPDVYERIEYLSTSIILQKKMGLSVWKNPDDRFPI